MKHIPIIWLIGLLFAGSLSAQQTGTGGQIPSDTLHFTLEAAIQHALEHNPNLQSVALNEVLLEKQISGAKSTILPQIQGTAGYADNYALPKQLLPGEIFGQEGQIAVKFGTRFGINAGVELSQLIYSKAYIESIKKLGVAQKSYQLQTLATKEDLVYNVIQGYIQYQILEEQLALLHSNLDRIQQLLDISQAQYQNGIIKKLDVDQLVINETNLTSEILNVEVMQSQQLNGIKILLGLHPARDIVLTTSLEQAERYPLSSTLLLQENINYQMLLQQIRLAEIENDVIKAGYYPTVSAFAQYGYQGQNQALNFKADQYAGFASGVWGINVQIPIFDGFQKKRKLQENAIVIQQLKKDQAQLDLWAEMEFANANHTIDQNEKLVRAQLKNMNLAQDLYHITQQSYQEGVAALTELLDAESSLRSAQAQYLTALLNFKQAELEHAKVSGQLAQLIKNNI